MNDLISVIITTHNRNVCLIERAFNSAENQSYKNIEIIIVSDNYKNQELQKNISDFFSNKSFTNVKVIFPKEELGANKARNIGAHYACGKYLAFLDDDDVWFSNKLEQQYLSISLDENVGLVYCDEYGFNEEKNLIFSKNYSDISKKPLNYFFKKGNILGGASNPLIKKECFEKVGCFDEKLLSSQDLDMWIRLAQKYKISFVNKKLLMCFYHDSTFDGITNNFQKKDRGYQQFCDKHWHIISQKRSYMKRVFQYKCAISILSKNKLLFKKRFRTLIFHYPLSLFSNAKLLLSWLRNL